MDAQQPGQTGHYAMVNGLKMYYEIHGSGNPLVLLHGGGSTIESAFGRLLPELAKNHKVIAIELQAHGRTSDIDRPLSFEQDADDVATLLGQLNIKKADILGFSNGGTTCLQMAIHHPDKVNKIIVASAIYKRSGMPPGFWEGMKQASLESMPKPLREAFLSVNPDPKALQVMFNRDVNRMLDFKDIGDQDMRSIQPPALVISGDRDVVTPEHTLELSRILPHAQLAILPGGHGEYIGEICAVDAHSKMPQVVTAMVEIFLEE